LRGRTQLPVTITPSLGFAVELPVSIQGVEAARLELDTHSTAYRWIDQPEALARFGARAYHTQVRAKLETFGGAEKLFQELMDFLWERFDPQKFTEDVGQERLTRKHRYARDKEREANGPPPPPADKFITDEKLLGQIAWGLGQQKPYDRSTWSLRDLISLALLRLTTPTQPPEILTDAGTIDERADQQRAVDREEERANALENLCNYVLRYCKRYGERLTDVQFVKKTNPQLLFNNHFTLGRILLEFSEKVDLFTPTDLKTCFWRAWAPLVYPSIVGYEGDSTLKLLRTQTTSDSIAQAWHQSGLSSLSVLIMNRSLGTPPGIQDGSSDLKRIQEFMAAREFIIRMKSELGEGTFGIDGDGLAEAQGIRSLSDLVILPADDISDLIAELRKGLNALAEFIPPTEGRYAPLRELQTLDRDRQGQSARADDLVQWFRRNGLERYLEFRSSRVPILPLNWNSKYCPKCNVQLTVENLNLLRDGKLVLCSYSKDAMIYWRPQLPKSVM